MDFSDLSTKVFDQSEEKTIWERACWEWDIKEMGKDVTLINLVNENTLEITLEELEVFPVLHHTDDNIILKNIKTLSLYSGVMHPQYRDALPSDISLPIPFSQEDVKLIKMKDSGTEMYLIQPDTPMYQIGLYLLEYGSDWRLPVWEYGGQLYITVSGNFCPTKADHSVVFMRFSENITCFFHFPTEDQTYLEWVAGRAKSEKEGEFIASLNDRNFLTNNQAKWFRTICQRTIEES